MHIKSRQNVDIQCRAWL